MSTPTHGELARRLEGLNVYLVGMMGAGKSAAGKPLAAALGYRFLDADTALEQVAGRSIPEIFASDGEEGFRTLAIEQRSSEVWQTLSAVKTEFSKFGTVLEKVKTKLQSATNEIDQVGTRTRAMQRQLRNVESAPEDTSNALFNQEPEFLPSPESARAEQ